MKVVNAFLTLAAAIAAVAIGTSAALAQSNVMSMTTKLGPYGYTNGAFTHLMICTPGSTTSCQGVTVNLVDTGSFGLRIFAQAKKIYLPPEFNKSGGKVAECAPFASFSSWGGIKQADVYMAGEPPARNVPIQIIASGALPPPSSCTATGPMLTSPQQVGFNGLLGVGLFSQDCGGGCTPTSTSNPGWYYSCSGGVCSQSAAGLGLQVTNPVSMLPQDNQGVLVEMPSIGSGGAPTASGSLILGINSQANNMLGSNASVLTADGSGEINTFFNNQWIPGFFDTGSNGLFFNDSSIPMCATNLGWYCPTIPITFSAMNAPASNFTPSKTSFFTVDNADLLFLSGNAAYNDLAAPLPGITAFDWGLPFFYGRNVWIGIYQPGVTLPFVAFQHPGA